MAYVLDPKIEHLLRRTGCGARQDELDVYRAQSFGGALTRLLDYERIPDDVDQKIGQAGYVGVTTRGQFAPNSVLTHGSGGCSVSCTPTGRCRRR